MLDQSQLALRSNAASRAAGAATIGCIAMKMARRKEKPKSIEGNFMMAERMGSKAEGGLVGKWIYTRESRVTMPIL